MGVAEGQGVGGEVRGLAGLDVSGEDGLDEEGQRQLVVDAEEDAQPGQDQDRAGRSAPGFP